MQYLHQQMALQRYILQSPRAIHVKFIFSIL